MKSFFVLASFAESLVGFRAPLIAALQQQGFHVHVGAPDLPSECPIRSKLELAGITVHEVPMARNAINPLKDLKTILALCRLLVVVRPDFFLSYTAKPVIYGSIAAWVASVPRRIALITGLGQAFSSPNNRPTLLERIVQQLYRFSLRRVSLVFFQNPDDEVLFRKRGILGRKTPSFVVNGSGIDVHSFQTAPLPEQPTFLLIARLIDGKGVRIYAEAARAVRDRHPHVRCLLVGWIDSSPNAITQEELDGWIHDGSIEYLGKLSDVRPAIAASSVFVLPSFYREGTPRTVLEALAMGRPIITTDTPGCRETVTDNRNGFLIPPRSSSALIEAMTKFVESPEIVKPMGHCSRLLAEEKYDVDKVNNSMLFAMNLIPKDTA